MQPPSPAPSPPPQQPLPPINPPHVIENYTAPELDNEPVAATAQPAVTQQFSVIESQADQTHHPNYEFIMNPTAVRTGGSFSSSSSLIKRVVVVAAGLIVLLIIFVIAKNVLTSTGSNAAALLSVAQEQQELIHLSASATKQPGIALSTLNSSTTITASVTSAQKQLLTYMRLNHQKIITTELVLKVSASTDTELKAAATAGTYDQTYQSVMQTVLTSYQQAAKRAYDQTTGVKGRALLASDYNGATLLLQQVTSTTP